MKERLLKVVAVTRVLNEEDIIEPMIRHHSALVDHHVLLDNGSVDRTIEILRALKTEGLPVTILQNGSVMFSEVQFNTILYQIAVKELAADWVVFLDADEFVDARPIGSLRSLLSAVPAGHQSLGVQLINYDSPTEESRHHVNVVERLIRRTPAPIDVWKVFVRGGNGSDSVRVDAGNHNIFLDDVYQAPPRQDHFVLAHYPTRSQLQWAGKAITGWLKVLAAGKNEVEQGRSAHYRPIFEQLKRDPRAWIEFALRHARDDVAPPSAALVEDPIAYLGAPLLYTEAVDPVWRTLAILLQNTEQLASAHGTLLDQHPSVRQRTEQDLGLLHVIAGPGSLASPVAGYGAAVTSIWRHASDKGFAALLGEGWSHLEDWGGIWGVGSVHELRLSHLDPADGDVTFDAIVQVPLIGSHVSQSVDVCVGGRHLATWDFTTANNEGQRSIHIPAAMLSCNSPVVVIAFRPRVMAVPADLDPESTDQRQIGLGVRCIRQLRAFSGSLVTKQN